MRQLYLLNYGACNLQTPQHVTRRGPRHRVAVTDRATDAAGNQLFPVTVREAGLRPAPAAEGVWFIPVAGIAAFDHGAGESAP